MDAYIEQIEKQYDDFEGLPESEYEEILQNVSRPPKKRGLPFGVSGPPASRKKRKAPLSKYEARAQDAPVRTIRTQE